MVRAKGIVHAHQDLKDRAGPYRLWPVCLSWPAWQITSTPCRERWRTGDEPLCTKGVSIIEYSLILFYSFLWLFFFPHTVYTKGLLSSDLMYSVASILFTHNKTKASTGNRLWLWIYSAISILQRNLTFHQQASKRTFSLISEMIVFFFSANASNTLNKIE